jgi:hypothetical protein
MTPTLDPQAPRRQVEPATLKVLMETAWDAGYLAGCSQFDESKLPSDHAPVSDFEEWLKLTGIST